MFRLQVKLEIPRLPPCRDHDIHVSCIQRNGDHIMVWAAITARTRTDATRKLWEWCGTAERMEVVTGPVENLIGWFNSHPILKAVLVGAFFSAAGKLPPRR